MPGVSVHLGELAEQGVYGLAVLRDEPLLEAVVLLFCVPGEDVRHGCSVHALSIQRRSIPTDNSTDRESFYPTPSLDASTSSLSPRRRTARPARARCRCRPATSVTRPTGRRQGIV